MQELQYYVTKKPSFCFVDDDCRTEAYTILKPMLEARGAKGTFASITGSIGEATRMTLAQMQDLVANGHEIISHTHTHRQLTTLTEAEIISEFENSKSILDGYGMTGDVLAYPNGLYNKQVVELAKKYFKCAMDTGDWSNGSPLHTYSLSRLGVGAWGFGELSAITTRIDDIIANKRLCILMTHVGDNTAAENTLIGQVLDYIISAGYQIQTFSDAYEEHKNILDIGEYDTSSDLSTFAVGGDGILGGVGANPVVTSIPGGGITAATPATYFEEGKITYAQISDSSASGFPQSQGGTLMTSRVAREDICIYQEYTLYMSGYRYIRYWNPYTPIWSNWMPICNYKNATTAEVNFDTGCTGFDASITITCFGNSDAADAPTPNIGGILITNHIVGYYEYTYQEYHPVGQKVVYKRIATSDNSWSTWSLLSSYKGNGRPVSVSVGNTYFDAALNKPIWCKEVGAQHKSVLTLSSGAAVAGNIAITLNEKITQVSVAAGDNIATVENKILTTRFPGWMVSTSQGSGIVTFTNRTAGVCTASSFADTGGTGVRATFNTTVNGSSNTWIDANGATV